MPAAIEVMFELELDDDDAGAVTVTVTVLAATEEPLLLLSEATVKFNAPFHKAPFLRL